MGLFGVKKKIYIPRGAEENVNYIKILLNNSAMPISSRRYLLAYEYVIKYLGFADKGADSHKLRGVNTKYLITAEPIGISFEISSFRNSHSLFEAWVHEIKFK